jgi:hypothetical protein
VLRALIWATRRLRRCGVSHCAAQATNAGINHYFAALFVLLSAFLPFFLTARCAADLAHRWLLLCRVCATAQGGHASALACGTAAAATGSARHRAATCGGRIKGSIKGSPHQETKAQVSDGGLDCITERDVHRRREAGAREGGGKWCTQCDGSVPLLVHFLRPVRPSTATLFFLSSANNCNPDIIALRCDSFVSLPFPGMLTTIGRRTALRT